MNVSAPRYVLYTLITAHLSFSLSVHPLSRVCCPSHWGIVDSIAVTNAIHHTSSVGTEGRGGGGGGGGGGEEEEKRLTGTQ